MADTTAEPWSTVEQRLRALSFRLRQHLFTMEQLQEQVIRLGEAGGPAEASVPRSESAGEVDVETTQREMRATMAAAVLTDEAEQIVGLELAGETYGIAIGRVQEILRLQPIMRVPNSPPGIQGLTNLRGRVIPVLDLRQRFGLPTEVPNGKSRIVVAELGQHTVGLLVDGVSEVLRVPAEAIEAPSVLVTTRDSTYLRGVAKLDGRLILLLDLAQILTKEEHQDLAELPATAGADERAN